MTGNRPAGDDKAERLSVREREPGSAQLLPALGLQSSALLQRSIERHSFDQGSAKLLGELLNAVAAVRRCRCRRSSSAPD